MALRPQFGLVQRQRLGLTQEIKSSLQYLALAGLRLEKTLSGVVDSNPFLTSFNNHSSQDAQDWLENMAAPKAENLGAALRLLAGDLFWREQDRALANLLIDEVAETGLLSTPLAALPRPQGVSLAELAAVQAAFLAEGGLLADDLGQCFAAQLAPLRAEDAEICADLSLLSQAAPEVLARFAALSRRPADTLDLAAPLLLPPDLILEQVPGGGWRARLNPMMHRTYALDEEALSTLSDTARKQASVAEPLAAARAAVRALAARAQTLTGLAAFLAAQQTPALLQGRARLAPLTQAQAAEALQLHPSTISRAVQGKTVETPQGVWALEAFFSPCIDAATGLSGTGLQHKIADLVAGEAPTAPLSDQSLTNHLTAAGHSLARRTVTKYRLALGLAGARDRRDLHARRAPNSTLVKET